MSDEALWKKITDAEEMARESGKNDQDSLIEAMLAAAQEELGRGGLTTDEIQKLTGWGSKKVRTVLLNLKSQGLIEVIERKTVALDNKVRGIPAYRLKE